MQVWDLKNVQPRQLPIEKLKYKITTKAKLITSDRTEVDSELTRPKKSWHLLLLILYQVYKCNNPEQGLQRALAKNIFVAIYS